YNVGRTERVGPAHVVTSHAALVPEALKGLEREGVRRVHVLRSPEEVASVTVARLPMRFDRRDDAGPFDAICDVHGCSEELLALSAGLGNRVAAQPGDKGLPEVVVEPPQGRKAIFVGALGDRGPDTPGVYRLVMPMVRAGRAYCVLGNHDNKLLRKLRGS